MFSYQAIDLWHDIPHNLKDLSTFSFAKEVKQYLLFKQYSYKLRKNNFKSDLLSIINWVWFLSSLLLLFLSKLTVNSY